MSLMKYDEVLKHLHSKKDRSLNLLLGNGFSMAYDSEIFSYNALQNFVEKLEDTLLSRIFEIVKTKNFELVMQQLENFCQLIAAFSSDEELLKEVKTAIDSLKKVLVDAIEGMHPDHVFKVSDQQCQSCAKFLKSFLDSDGNIFSTNYDLLLYWVLMRGSLSNRDGFGRDLIDDSRDSEPVYSDELFWGRNPMKVHYAWEIFQKVVDELPNGSLVIS